MKILYWLYFLPRRLARSLIHLYQGWSKNRPPSCRFVPTCSAYAEEAISNRGLLVGICYSIARLARCNPFGSSGFHPAPIPRADRNDYGIKVK